MLICFAPNQNKQKFMEKQEVWRGHKFLITNNISRFLLSLWKFQQFERFHSTLMLKEFHEANVRTVSKKVVHLTKG